MHTILLGGDREKNSSLLERNSFYFYKFIRMGGFSGKQRVGCLFGKLGAKCKEIK